MKTLTIKNSKSKENEKEGKGEKKCRNRGKINKKAIAENVITPQKKAARYLKAWHKDRKNWKFEKLQQIWLIKHMFDPVQVPNKVFNIFVDYISKSRGQVLERIKESCQEVVNSLNIYEKLQEDGLRDAEIDASQPKMLLIKEKAIRARRILQCLVEEC